MKQLLFSSLFLLTFSPCAFAFDNVDTHRELTKITVEKSKLNNILPNELAINSYKDIVAAASSNNTNIQEWFMEGSFKEDKPFCRASNHFLNPLKPWNKAGLSDPFFLADLWCMPGNFREKHSNIVWATGMTKFVNAPDEEPTLINPPINNDYNSPSEGRSWLVARRKYAEALKAEDPHKREELLAQTFETLGYVLHLLEDMAVPAHTRNDFSTGQSDMVAVS